MLFYNKSTTNANKRSTCLRSNDQMIDRHNVRRCFGPYIDAAAAAAAADDDDDDDDDDDFLISVKIVTDETIKSSLLIPIGRRHLRNECKSLLGFTTPYLLYIAYT